MLQDHEITEQGADAARNRIGFDKCPYTFANSRAASMDEYAASGNNKRRDLWFAGWQAEKERLGLDHRMRPNP